MATRAVNRAKELFRRLTELENQAAKIQAEREAVESELSALIPDNPRTGARSVARRTKTAEGNPTENSTSGSGATAVDWTKKGALAAAIGEAFRVHRGEWTAREIIEKAGIPSERRNSAKAAVSRLFTGEKLERGTKEGTYRLKS
jgi:hypothetical protein